MGSTTRGTWWTSSGLQGLLAHQRGEWFSSFRTELRRTQGHDRLAGALFDAHLCVAENLLYGREPYPEIIAEAEQLRLRARQAGALRGVAFATALIGEAALMMGDVDRAEAELEEAVELHADIDAVGGQAHSLQRLAEVRLAQGRSEEARAAARRGAAAGALVDHGHAPAATHLRDPDRLLTGPAVGASHGRPGREHPGRTRPMLVLHRDARGSRCHSLRSRR